MVTCCCVQHTPCSGVVLRRSAWSRGALPGLAALCLVSRRSVWYRGAFLRGLSQCRCVCALVDPCESFASRAPVVPLPFRAKVPVRGGLATYTLPFSFWRGAGREPREFLFGATTQWNSFFVTMLMCLTSKNIMYIVIEYLACPYQHLVSNQGMQKCAFSFCYTKSRPRVSKNSKSVLFG